MVDRKMVIKFLESGAVEYDFHRCSDKCKPYNYLIEYPANLVEIIGETPTPFRKSTTPSGSLYLEAEATWDGMAGIQYRKLQFLTRIQETPLLWRYEEAIRIKARKGSYGLWLHGPRERLSAVGSLSSAVFYANSGHRTTFKPRELTERAFNESGELRINWVLELDRSVAPRPDK